MSARRRLARRAKQRGAIPATLLAKRFEEIWCSGRPIEQRLVWWALTKRADANDEVNATDAQLAAWVDEDRVELVELVGRLEAAGHAGLLEELEAYLAAGMP